VSRSPFSRLARAPARAIQSFVNQIGPISKQALNEFEAQIEFVRPFRASTNFVISK
jgi:hypothetical protein